MDAQKKKWITYVFIVAILFVVMNFGSHAAAATQAAQKQAEPEQSSQMSYQEQRKLLLENMHKASQEGQEERSLQTIMAKEYFSIGMVVLVVAVIVYIISFSALLVLLINGNKEDENQAVVES